MRIHQEHSLSPPPIDISLDSSLPGARPSPGPFLAREEHCNVHTCRCERQYDKAGIGIVISGRFDYNAQTGTATGVPGTIVFGNVGEYFQVRHLDSRDIHRLAVWFDQSFLEEIASAHDLANPRFHVAALPPGKVASGMFAQMLALTRGWVDSDEAVSDLAATALTINGDGQSNLAISYRDRQRIFAAVDYIEHAFSEPCSVDTLAAISGSSRFHFMRLFKAVTGQSPNQYLINMRLRAAAARIVGTKAPVSEIALDCGFNDVSHFNACFRTMFACTPRQMRQLSRAA